MEILNLITAIMASAAKNINFRLITNLAKESRKLPN